jgi:hypothetical protein
MASAMAACVLAATAHVQRCVEVRITIPNGEDASATIRTQVLTLPLLAPHISRTRVTVARMQRAVVLVLREAHRVSDRLEVRDIAATALPILNGVGMIAAIEPAQPALLVARIAELIDELCDVSNLRFRNTDSRIITLIQSGERDYRAVGNATGLKPRSLTLALSGVVAHLEIERRRRDLRLQPGPLDEKPLAVLGLHWSVEFLLTLRGAIDTVGQLCRLTEDQVLRIKGMGIGRLQHLKRRLWEEERRTLLDSEPPTQAELEDSSFGDLFVPVALPLGTAPLVTLPLDPWMGMAMLSSAIVGWMAYQKRADVRRRIELVMLAA